MHIQVGQKNTLFWRGFCKKVYVYVTPATCSSWAQQI